MSSIKQKAKGTKDANTSRLSNPIEEKKAAIKRKYDDWSSDESEDSDSWRSKRLRPSEEEDGAASSAFSLTHPSSSSSFSSISSLSSLSSSSSSSLSSSSSSSSSSSPSSSSLLSSPSLSSSPAPALSKLRERYDLLYLFIRIYGLSLSPILLNAPYTMSTSISTIALLLLFFYLSYASLFS